MRKIAGLLFVFFVFSACGKQTNMVPDIGVNINGFFTPSQLSELKAKGAILIDGGVAGIIIAYNVSTDGAGGYSYKAYDRCSTVNPEKKCALTIENPYNAVDPCSGAQFLLLDGSPSKAPAKVSLRRYRISVSGNNNYQVTN